MKNAKLRVEQLLLRINDMYPEYIKDVILNKSVWCIRITVIYTSLD